MEVRDRHSVEGRRLRGEKAVRIVEAMRASVAEVGVSESTFDRVSAKAGVSRGLLHYYFGTKERLLIEVIRRDTAERIEALRRAVGTADDADELVAALIQGFRRASSERQGYVYMVCELFVAGRHNPEIRRELGTLFGRTRAELAEILREMERRGVVALRFDAETVVAHLFAAGDGATVQELCDPTFDADASSAAVGEVARFMLAPA